MQKSGPDSIFYFSLFSVGLNRSIKGIIPMRNIFLAAMSTLAFSGIADARMYKCTDPNGTVMYSERPCEQGTQKTIKLNDNSFAPIAPPARVDSNAGPRPGTASANSGSRAGAQSSGRGTPVWAQKGMSSEEVRDKLGNPDIRDDSTLFGGSRKCDDGGFRDVWMYDGKDGNLGQKITFCDSKVVDVETLSPGSKHAAPSGSNRTGHTGGSVTAQRGWTRMQVVERMGQPDSRKPMTFSGNSLCPQGDRIDTFVYNRRGGNLGQTLIFCNDAVIDVKYD